MKFLTFLYLNGFLTLETVACSRRVQRKLIEESRSRKVLGIEDFTEADSEAIQRMRPSLKSAAFNHELTEDP